MTFYVRNELGEIVRNRVVVDCSGDEILTEQSHKQEVDINQIIKKYGMDLIRKTELLNSQEYRFDDVTGNDFQEAMNILVKAEGQFNSMPSAIRKRFNNSPAEFLDFVQNPDNAPEMIALGLATAVEKTQPVQVVVMNPETPPSPE